jgi:O-antigen/teichoic acid export membrane protein
MKRNQEDHTRKEAGGRDLQGVQNMHGEHSERPLRKAAKKPAKQHKPNFFARTINAWFSRLIGAAALGSFSKQDEMYAAHRTSRDYVWNSLGIGSWGMVFPLLTIVATQLSGVEHAGMFSMAFVVGTLLMFLANYGVRTYQVSDLEEAHSFSDYQINRVITCVVMVVAGILYCAFKGYAPEMFTISMAVYCYKMIDGLADVYEGRLQQVDKLYLAGISQTLRSVFVIVIFTLCLLLTRNLSIACIAMAVVALLSFIIITLPLALLETPRAHTHSFASIADLFKQCFPLFIALFMYALIDNMPKFFMEAMLPYDNQLYFNVFYFPAMAIMLCVGLVYKPQLVRMANLWADPASHKKFDLMVGAVIAVIVLLVVVMVLLMGWVGISAMNFLYGEDFKQATEGFTGLYFVMLIAGGITACIDFLYQVITVLRKQKAVMKLYVITFGFALFVPFLLIRYTDLLGAMLSYLIVMSILFVLLVMEFFRIRMNFWQEFATQKPEMSMQERRAELSEARARRARVDEIRKRYEDKQDNEE